MDRYFQWLAGKANRDDQQKLLPDNRIIVVLHTQQENNLVGTLTFNLSDVLNKNNYGVIDLDGCLELNNDGQVEEIKIMIKLKILSQISLDVYKLPKEIISQYSLQQKGILLDQFKHQVLDWRTKYESLLKSIELLTKELSNLSMSDSTQNCSEISQEIIALRKMIKQKLHSFLKMHDNQNEQMMLFRKELDIYKGQLCISCSRSLLKDKVDGYQNQISDLRQSIKQKDENILVLEKEIKNQKQLNDQQALRNQQLLQSQMLLRQSFSKSKQQADQLSEKLAEKQKKIQQLTNIITEQESILKEQRNDYMELEQCNMEMVNIFLKTIDLYKQWNLEVVDIFEKEEHDKAKLIKSLILDQEFSQFPNINDYPNKSNLNNTLKLAQQDNLLLYEKQIQKLKIAISSHQLQFLNKSTQEDSMMKRNINQSRRESINSHTDFIKSINDSQVNIISQEIEDKLLELYNQRINISNDYQQYITALKTQNYQLLENYKLHEESNKQIILQNEQEIANLKYKIGDILNMAIEYGNIKFAE